MPLPNEEQKPISEVILDALRMKNLNAEKLAQLSGIPEHFIGLLLEDKYEKLPALPYTHGYILHISEILGLDGEQLWRDYLKYNKAMRRSGERDVLPSNRFETPKISGKMILVLLLLIILFAYAVSQVPGMIGKPALMLKNFEDNAVVAEPIFEIRGEIKTTDELTINGELVYPDQNGKFSKIASLEPGFNTFTFKIKRFLGKENTITKQIYYQVPPQDLPQEPEKLENGAN